jgi:putative SOS response-associated peptidase YedK
MCGRFSNTKSPQKIKERYPIADLPLNYKPRYNIAPSQEVLVVVEQEKPILTMMRWGLIPSWAKDPSIGNQMINARGESIREKPSFKRAFQQRRCLVPADGFYEWMKSGKKKVPIRFILKDQALFSFAGLWDVWKNPDGRPIETFTIITTQANPTVGQIHNRMPVILQPEDEPRWLALRTDSDQLFGLLKPYAGELQCYPVSTRLNSPTNDDPQCITPLTGV